MKYLALLAVFMAMPLLAAQTCNSTLGGPACSGGPGSICVNNSWTASTTPNVTYNIYRSATSKGENYSTPLNTAPISGTTYQDNAIPAGATQLYYTVAAVPTGGLSSVPSNEACAQIPPPTAPPTNEVAAPQ